MASPDHYQAALITEAAVFYSRLTKWDEEFGELPPHHIPALLYYFLAHRALSPVRGDGLVVDITSVLEKKLAAIDCYESQFGHRPEVLERFRTLNQQHGAAAGFAAGEVVANCVTWGTRDLMGQLFPPSA
jgi:LmbE family N-acetylglucosaminyl deacetylase